MQFYQTSQTGLEGSWKTVNVSLGYLAGNGSAGTGDYSRNFVAYNQGVDGSGTAVGGSVSANRKISGVRPMIAYGKNGYPLVYASGTAGSVSTAYNYPGPLMAFLPQNETAGGGYVGNKTATRCFLGLIEVQLDSTAAPTPAPGAEKQPGTITVPVLPDIEVGSAGVLSDVELPSGWSWVDGSTELARGTHDYPARYAIPAEDLARYDYSQVDGFDAQTGTVTRMLSITVNAPNGSTDGVTVKIGRNADVYRVDGGDAALARLKALPQFAGARDAALSIVVGKEGEGSSLSQAMRNTLPTCTFRSFFYMNLYLNAGGRMVEVSDSNTELLTVDLGTMRNVSGTVRLARIANGVVNQITATPNAQGEYVSYNAKTGELVAHVKKLGTFGVAYGR